MNSGFCYSKSNWTFDDVIRRGGQTKHLYLNYDFLYYGFCITSHYRYFPWRLKKNEPNEFERLMKVQSNKN